MLSVKIRVINARYGIRTVSMYDGPGSKLDINVILLPVAMLAAVNERAKATEQPSLASSALTLLAGIPPSVSIASVQVTD